MRLLPSRNAGRWAVLGIAFTAVVMAATPEKDGGAVNTAYSAVPFQVNAPSSLSARTKQRPPETAHVELERLARLQSKPEAESESEAEPEMEIGNVFGATSWYVPPPPPPQFAPASLPPPVPTAPPMPFTYLGRYEDVPTLLAILVKGERMYVVAEGDVIEDTYRIEHLAPGMVELTYLPLNIKQSLSTGEAL